MTRRKPSNPATIYLSRWPKSHDTYKTMRGALKRAAQALDDEDDPEKYPWHEIDYATAVELPALLQDGDLAPASVNKILVAVRGALEAAWRSGQIDDDQYRKIEIKSVKGSGKSVGRALSDDEAEKFETALEKAVSKDAAVLTMMFACGMRRVGIVRARVGDYDSETGSLTSRGKGGKMSVLPVVEHLRKYLDRYWQELGRASGDLPAFGAKFTRRTVSWTVERFCKDSGIERFTPHDLRRSYCTLLLKRGVPISVAQRLMQHSSIATTGLYDRSGREAEIEAVKVLGKAKKKDEDKMIALIVWNNGESYDGNKTYCIAVDPAELDDTVKLLRLDCSGSVLAFAKNAQCCYEPDSLDEVLEYRAFHICLPWDADKRDGNHAALMQLSPPLRERVAKALLSDRGYHESHKHVIEAIVEKLRSTAT